MKVANSTVKATACTVCRWKQAAGGEGYVSIGAWASGLWMRT